MSEKFQSTPPCGGRRRGMFACYAATGFNPRPRAGGDVVVCRLSPTRGRFNPRPRAGGDMPFWQDLDGNSVSIHAPVRGATAALLR